jgi:hypothetical protein
MGSKANGQHPAPETDTIPYDDAVREGKGIIAQIADAERGQLRLGELADKLEPKYGDRTLAKFAAEIDVAKCTLDRYRTVYRAYASEGKLAPGPKSASYAVLRELATHPDREHILRADPNLTKREARKLIRDHKNVAGKKQKQDQESDWLKHSRKWFKDLVTLANEVHRATDVVNGCTPEQLENLLEAVDAGSLMYLRGGGRSLFNLANHLAELLGEEVEQFATKPITLARRAEEGETAQVRA